MIRAIKRLSLSVAAIIGFVASVLQILGIASLSVLLRGLPKEIPVSPVWIGIAAGSFMAVLAVSVGAFLWSAARALKRPRRPFDVTEEHFHFKVRQNDVAHTAEFVIKNHAAGNWAFPYRYYWSGGTKPNLRVVSPPGATFFESGREMQWTVGQVVFPIDILKGKDITVEIETISADTDFQNILGRTPQEAIEKLTLEVTLDNGGALADVAQLILETPSDPSTRTNVPTDRSRSQAHHHLWTMQKPQVGRQYMLAWK